MRRVSDEAKDRAAATIRGHADALLALSRTLHAAPELAFQEHMAVRAITDFLVERGVTVDAPAFGLATAFSSECGAGDQVIALCAEYDALPGIGHACGHNVIAGAAVGAFLGLQAVADSLPFTVRLLGTPGEEAGNGAGKVLMLEAGAFDGVSAAMMVHPAPFDVLKPNMIAAAQLEVQYSGKESHAAFYPELGINAADALAIAQVALAFLRQSLLPTDRLHGITTHGGSAPNIIPASAAGRFMVRAATQERLNLLLQRVTACFEAGAKATGATLSVSGGDLPYAQVDHNHRLAELFRLNAGRLGRQFAATNQDERPSGSTDMGNVSLTVPSIHPFIGIGSWPAVNHQPEFTAHCVTSGADEALLDGALAMAWTAIDLAGLTDIDSFLSAPDALEQGDLAPDPLTR